MKLKSVRQMNWFAKFFKQPNLWNSNISKPTRTRNKVGKFVVELKQLLRQQREKYEEKNRKKFPRLIFYKKKSLLFHKLK